MDGIPKGHTVRVLALRKVICLPNRWAAAPTDHRPDLTRAVQKTRRNRTQTPGECEKSHSCKDSVLLPHARLAYHPGPTSHAILTPSAPTATQCADANLCENSHYFGILCHACLPEHTCRETDRSAHGRPIRRSCRCPGCQTAKVPGSVPSRNVHEG